MASLRDTQLAFADAVLFDSDERIGMLIDGGLFSPSERIAIYRNNARIGFLSTMEAAFPVVKQLGGDDWFEQTIRRYQQRHPSSSGNLHHVGERFAGYLLAELDGSSHAYFADIARLEWAYQEVLVAEDSSKFDVSTLAHVPPERYGALQFQLHPATRLISSCFPILKLWQAHRDDSATGSANLDTIDMNAGENVLVLRRPTHVELRALPLNEFRLLQTFASGATLEHALNDDELDAISGLTRVAQLGALGGFTFDTRI